MTDQEYPCAKKQKCLSIYSSSRNSGSVTLTAINSTCIFTYSLWITLALSSCLLQRIILCNSWVPFPSECQSTWQVLVSILTSFFQKENWSKINWGIHQGVSQANSETCLRIETGTLSPIPSLKMRLWNSALLEATVFWTFLCVLSSRSGHQCTISIYLWGEFIKQHLGNWERLRTPSWNRFCNSFVIFYPEYTWIFLKACKIEYDNRKIPCS